MLEESPGDNTQEGYLTWPEGRQGMMRDETGGGSSEVGGQRGQLLMDLVGHVETFKFGPLGSWRPLDSFEQDSDRSGVDARSCPGPWC